MKINSLTLQYFKGCKSGATYTFNGKNATVCGANGSGKTTISDGYYWLFSDRTTELKSNPQIRPIDVEECTPRFEVCFDVDGKPVTAVKIQKCTKKGNSVSISNTYEVNSVEYGERDFKNKMDEYSFDFDKFLLLSHPDAFIANINEKKIMEQRRNLLFAMASKKTDKEIADLTEGAYDAAKLLENYTFEEVKAMQNATLRKIREVYGKDGEILRATIEGMERSKSDIDVAELELQRNALNEQIAANKTKQEDISKQYEDYQKLSDGILELKLELNGLQQKANLDLEKKRAEIRGEISAVDNQISDVARQINLSKRSIMSIENAIKENENARAKQKELWHAATVRVFDEDSLKCPYCGQEYPAEKKEQMRAEFEAHRTEELKRITDKGMELKASIEKGTAELEQLKATLKENEENERILAENANGMQAVYDKLPTSIDISETDEYKAIQSQISEKEAAMQKENSADEIRKTLKAELEELQAQLTEVEKQIALSQRNIEIDEQIEDLRNKQSEYEQDKANYEKILYQLDLISKRKNELLTDDINKHFDIVRWQMFEYQKNGEIKDCCVPRIDGMRFGESTNRGREILAKLDIIKGLQNFYGQYYPVFLDNAESLSEETLKRINMPCQLIMLKVTDDKELKVEVE